MTAATELTNTATHYAKSIAALPPLPVTAQKILTCFGDEFIDAEKVAQVVEGDPGICAKLLGLANSAYFGLAEPVGNIEAAISRVLGVDTVRSLVLAMAIQQSFNSKGCPAFDIERFWLQSLLAAECCKRIVLADELAEDSDRDLAYTAGLCHNLGLMALAHMSPEQTNKALLRHKKAQQADTLAVFFREEFETDHKVLTTELGRIWSLPAAMVSAYAYRANPESSCEGRLGFIVATGVTAVENAELDVDQRINLAPMADEFSLDASELQEMAVFGNKQKERIQSLASNMTR